VPLKQIDPSLLNGALDFQIAFLSSILSSFSLMITPPLAFR